VLAGENARRDPGREFAKQAVSRIIEIVKFVLLTHRSSLKRAWRIDQDLSL
jgi:hypothetical protein